MKRAPFVWGVFGARGTGKTAWCVQELARMKPARLMVWDFKADHALAGIGQPYTDWPAYVQACKRPTFAARYIVSPDHDPHQQFDAWCALAWREGNAVLFVDELAEVTKANKAPPAWRKVINVGRSYADGKKSLSIIAASQRPTEVDKSFLSNADLVHTGRLGFVNDCRALAQQWGIDHAEIASLPNLQWIEKRASEQGVKRGRLTFEARK